MKDGRNQAGSESRCELDQILDDVEVCLAEEERQIALAGNYADSMSLIEARSFDDFSVEVYFRMDSIITSTRALEVINSINQYMFISDAATEALAKKYGTKNQAIAELKRYRHEFNIDNVKDVWSLKETSYTNFIRFIKFVCRTCDAKFRPVEAHTSMLRFYVGSLLKQMSDFKQDERQCTENDVKIAFTIGSVLKDMEFSVKVSDDTFSKVMHSKHTSKQRNLHEQSVFVEESKVAKAAWDYGCELLHTQMLHLLEAVMGVRQDCLARVKKRLGDIAPAGKKFGPGNKKSLSGCPCDKGAGCPLKQRYRIHEYIDLPTSRKPNRATAQE